MFLDFPVFQLGSGALHRPTNACHLFVVIWLPLSPEIGCYSGEFLAVYGDQAVEWQRQ
jgi:hypothetical protein